MADESPTQRFSREFPRGTVLFREGDAGAEMYVIQAGRIDITKRAGEVEKLLATLGQGEFFGEMSLLNQKPRSATATVVEDARLLVIDGRTFEAMLRANAEVAIRMIRKLAARLQEADDQIETLLHRDSTARVVHWLLQQVERAGGGPVAIAPAELAARVGVTGPQAAEALERLERAQLAHREGAGLRVADAARLRGFLDFLQLKARYEGIA